MIVVDDRSNAGMQAAQPCFNVAFDGIDLCRRIDRQPAEVDVERVVRGVEVETIGQRRGENAVAKAERARR